MIQRNRTTNHRSTCAALALVSAAGVLCCAPIGNQNNVAPPCAPQSRVTDPPESVGGFRRGPRDRFADSSLGVAYRYFRDDSTSLSLFLYPVSESRRSDRPTVALRKEADEFKYALKIGVAAPEIQAYEIAYEAPDSLDVGGVPVHGYEIGYVFRANDVPFQSYFVVYLVGNVFVKVRGTLAMARKDGSDFAVFARESLKQIDTDFPRRDSAGQNRNLRKKSPADSCPRALRRLRDRPYSLFYRRPSQSSVP